MSSPQLHPTDVLVEEHDVISSVLTALESELDRLAAGVPIDNHFWKGAVDFFAVYADRCHHGREEDLLFPALTAAGLPRANGPVACLLDEHEQGRCRVRSMREAINQSDRTQLLEHGRAYAALLRDHIEKENNVLFVIARRMLSQEVADGMLREFRAHDQGELGRETRARYVELARELCSRSGAPFHGTAGARHT